MRRVSILPAWEGQGGASISPEVRDNYGRAEKHQF